MSQKNVVVELQGGLGNQLFGWAAGYALARKLDCGLTLDTSQLYQRGYQLEDFEFSSSLRVVSQKRNLMTRLQDLVKGNVFQEKGFRYDPEFENLTSPMKLRGYFQSWKYHNPIQDEIYDQVRRLRVKSPDFLALENKFDFSSLTAVHVRRGDYKALEEYHGTVKADFYEKSIGTISQLQQTQTPFIVFSDEPEEAQKVVPGAVAYIGPRELSSPSENLILMSQCKALVGANSSFSLWAGMIMTPKTKTRIFPMRWFTEPSIDAVDLVPPEFLRLAQ